jgi:16S rRNA (cytosine967-C5)-methyltransferase
MPLGQPILDGCALAWANMIDGRRSADRALTRTLYSLKGITRPEKAFIAQTTMDMLRIRSLLLAQQDLIRVEHHPRHPVYLYLIGHAGLTARDIAPGDEQLRFALSALAQWPAHEEKLSPDERLALTSSLPLWLIERLNTIFGKEEAAAFATASRAAPPVILRTNTLKASREELRTRLGRESAINPHPSNRSPYALTLPPHTRVLQTPAFKDGWFELQDEGSQMLGLLCEATPGIKLVDACAGAGGKTLLLAAQMENKGTIWALDAYAHRLDELKPRARRAGVHNVHADVIEGQDGKRRLDRLRGAADIVLIDAPCSGTGSLRRNPDGVDRLTPERIDFIVNLQGEILERYSALVRPGGRLVYATCSVLPEENQGVVATFLAAHPEFTQLDPRPILNRQGATFPKPDHGGMFLQLFPQRHGTDGFFGAVFQRADAPIPEAPAEEPAAEPAADEPTPA